MEISFIVLVLLHLLGCGAAVDWQCAPWWGSSATMGGDLRCLCSPLVTVGVQRPWKGEALVATSSGQCWKAWKRGVFALAAPMVGLPQHVGWWRCARWSLCALLHSADHHVPMHVGWVVAFLCNDIVLLIWASLLQIRVGRCRGAHATRFPPWRRFMLPCKRTTCGGLRWRDGGSASS
jgi:hypothetical protein